jgi:hypothetical protein
MRETVEAHTTGAPCLFLQGASGEFGPREQYVADVSVADSNGRKLGYAALSTLAGMLPPRTRLEFGGVVESGAPLALWNRTPDIREAGALQAVQIDVELDLRPMPTVAELDAQLAASDDRVVAERIARRRRIRRDMGDGATTIMPLWVWRVGDALLIGHPNEAYSPLQTALRQQFPDLAIAVMNVTNGHYGYLPPAPLYDQDIYQVWQSPFERGGLERLIEVSRNAIRDLLD